MSIKVIRCWGVYDSEEDEVVFAHKKQGACKAELRAIRSGEEGDGEDVDPSSNGRSETQPESSE